MHPVVPVNAVHISCFPPAVEEDPDIADVPAYYYAVVEIAVADMRVADDALDDDELCVAASAVNDAAAVNNGGLVVANAAADFEHASLDIHE